MTPASLKDGHYARKQLFSQSGLIRWSHRRRFAVAVRKSASFAGRRILDLGCGDATYFLLLFQSPHAPAEAIGAEIDPRVIASNRARFAAYPQISFIGQEELDQPGYRGSFDAVVSMEVFEHLCDPDRYLDQIRALLRPGGRLLLSVPVETGPSLLLKQLVRRVAAWRQIGEYQYTLPYTWSELARSVWAGNRQHIPRVTHFNPGGFTFHCHKGFNWRTLRDRIAARFTLDRISTSPLNGLPAGLNSQVWIEAHRPAELPIPAPPDRPPPPSC